MYPVSKLPMKLFNKKFWFYQNSTIIRYFYQNQSPDIPV